MVATSGCKMGITSHGAFQKDNPIQFAIPLLMIQMCFVLALTRALAFLLKPLRQPRVVAEIIVRTSQQDSILKALHQGFLVCCFFLQGGILLGPSAFGRNKEYLSKIFPSTSIMILDTVANLGLIFFLFMVGLELDLNSVRRTGKQALVIAAAGITTPFATGVGVSIVLRHSIAGEGKFSAFLVFMGVAMSITAFPVLARILAERKLLTTDIGQIAMSAAAVNDVVAWILLALAVALSGQHSSPTVALWVLLTGLAYLVVMFVAVQRFMGWVARHVSENEPVKEIYVCITFAGVLASAFVTDAIGIHSIFGAFVFGLVIPKEGPLAQMVIEKVEDFVIVLMLPLYFVSSGLKTNIQSIHGARSAGLTVLVIVSACVGKVVGTVIPAMVYGIKPRKALTLGFLMNTKGLVELIVLNIGKERGVLNDEVFAIMVIMALVTTFITTPVVMSLHKPQKPPVPYLLKKLEMCTVNDELRVVSCLHDAKNVPGVISLVEQVRGRSRHPMRLYILHLIELSERSSAIVLVHNAKRNGRLNRNVQGESHIYVVFQAFGHLSEVKVRPMTIVSGFSDMHEDICRTAGDRRGVLLLLPFHKTYKPDGTLETLDVAFQMVNLKTLDEAPCSVGIFVNRGLEPSRADPAAGGGFTHVVPKFTSHTVLVLFFGGPDDREALAMGCRISAHPGVKVKVIHFVSSTDESTGSQRRSNNNMFPRRRSLRKSFFQRETREQNVYRVDLESINFERERELDVDSINSLRNGKENEVEYQLHHTPDPIESVLEVMRDSSYNLVLVGRQRTPSKLIASLNHMSIDYEELGPIGSLLAASDPGIKASVVVLQQHQQGMNHPHPPNLVQQNPDVEKNPVEAPPPVVQPEQQQSHQG